MEKAFDSLEWGFLYAVLERFILGWRIWTRLLYTKQKDRVKTGGVQSDSYIVGRGARQRCAWSPLLFALVVEPLCPGKGIDMLDWRQKTGHHHIALYADMLLFGMRRTIWEGQGASLLSSVCYRPPSELE